MKRTATRTLVAAMTTAIVLALTSAPSTADTSQGFCDAGWSELFPVTSGGEPDRIPVQHIGSVCAGPGTDHPVNVRLDFTGMPSTGEFHLNYMEAAPTSGPVFTTRTDFISLPFTTRDTRLASKTMRQTLGGRVVVDANQTGSYQPTKTVIDQFVPVTVSVPKTRAQVTAAKKARSKATAKAKKQYKRVLTAEKSSKTARSKKAKKTYLAATRKAQRSYRRATAPGTTTVMTVTTKQVNDGPPAQFSEGRIGVTLAQ